MDDGEPPSMRRAEGESRWGYGRKRYARISFRLFPYLMAVIEPPVQGEEHPESLKDRRKEE